MAENYVMLMAYTYVSFIILKDFFSNFKTITILDFQKMWFLFL